VSRRPLRRAVAAVAAVAACAAGMLAVGCQTTSGDHVVQSAAPGETVALDALADRLLALQVSPDSGALVRLRADLDAAARQPGLGPRALARADALRAAAALAAGDEAAAGRLAADAAAQSEAEEGVWVVRARLEKDPAARLAVIERGLGAADTRARLTAERGEALLALGRAAEAAQDLEEGLRGLAPGYAALYGADRDRARALARAGADAAALAPGAPDLAAPLTLRSLVDQTLSGSRLLSTLSTAAAPSFKDLAPALRTAGLLLEPAPAADSVMARRDVAWFLWGLVARTEHDARLLTKYRQKYTQSPVPDVAVTDPWFDAVLGTVEREIMDLPDGVHFMPSGPVTGLELLGMLARMKALYP
jgi:hypothetical protein